MSMAFVCLGCTLQFVTSSAIKLLVCSGVGSCLCPISLSMILMYTALRAIMYRPVSLASVADDITYLIMCAMLKTAPWFCGMALLLERKKCDPALLCAFVYSGSWHCGVLPVPFCLGCMLK